MTDILLNMFGYMYTTAPFGADGAAGKTTTTSVSMTTTMVHVVHALFSSRCLITHMHEYRYDCRCKDTDAAKPEGGGTHTYIILQFALKI